METIILVSDTISKSHDSHNSITLSKIIQTVYADAFPYAIKLPVYVMLTDMDTKQPVDVQIAVYDRNDELLAFSSKFIMRNEQKEPAVPSAQSGVKLTFAVAEEGPIFVKLFINEVEQKVYPIHVIYKDDAA